MDGFQIFLCASAMRLAQLLYSAKYTLSRPRRLARYPAIGLCATLCLARRWNSRL